MAEREAVIYDQRKILNIIEEKGRITTADLGQLGYAASAQSIILVDLEKKGLIRDSGYTIIEKPVSIEFNDRVIGDRKGKGCRSYCLTETGRNLKNLDYKEVIIFRVTDSLKLRKRK